ncbi:MAG: glycosyltransferase [Magnetococcales bacterium]|nr:glycosyltransferase [Magnetococcales bacterium]
MRIYIYQPLEFHFHSGITLGVIQEYLHLARLGHEVFVYGSYTDPAGFQEIRDFIGAQNIHLLAREGPLEKWRTPMKLRFLFKALTDRKPGKVFVTRHFNKALDLVWLKPLLGSSCIHIYEAHEDGFPHLLPVKRQENVEKIRKQTETILRLNHGLLLNNFSQEVILHREFATHPPVINLPNGVDPELFSQAVPPPWSDSGPFVVTYTGQFTAWKNVELLFAAVGQLDERFSLRISGGKSGAGHAESLEYVMAMARKHGLEGRVDFRGFVSRKALIEEVLNGSSVLAMPMGDNMRARYLTSPMKLFEAMATRIPIAAIDFPSVNLVIGPDTAFLAQSDPADFARAIRAAALDIAERPERIARQNAIGRQFTHAVRAERYHRWLTETLCQGYV